MACRTPADADLEAGVRTGRIAEGIFSVLLGNYSPGVFEALSTRHRGRIGEAGLSAAGCNEIRP